MITALYKQLKSNGTTLYVFPGASEDISIDNYNDNIQLKFSKFVCLNIPRQEISGVLKPKFDIENTFEQLNISVPPTTFADALIESLRNYVTNQESVIRNSKINSTEYLYNSKEIRNVTERIFWKWCKKLNIIDFELAKHNEQWNRDSAEFINSTSTADNFFNEYLWTERNPKKYNITSASWSANKVSVVLNTSHNYRVGDVIYTDITQVVGKYIITDILTTTATNDTLKFAYNSNPGTLTILNKTVNLDYDRLVKYIGNILLSNNVQNSEGTSTEIYAQLDAQFGQTPYVLFKTIADSNYKPNVIFPLLSNQQQPEISGAENSNSPIISNSSNYPGDFYGHFDNSQYQYQYSNGDSLRKQGDYFGVKVDAKSSLNGFAGYPNFNANELDGISLDFDIKHYLKAQQNIPTNNTFEDFNSTSFDNVAPVDFEFNAILWYYDITDVTTNETSTNLYGIQFLNNPNNDTNVAKTKIPTMNKYVYNGTQDGTAYTFSLSLKYNIENNNLPASFDENKVHNLFSFDLYNEALKRLSIVTSKYNNNISKITSIQKQIETLNSLLYTQPSIETINEQMSNLENLLQSYSTLQIGNSDSIEAYIDNSSVPSKVKLRSIDKSISEIIKINTSDLFVNKDNGGLIIVNSTPKNITFSTGKDFQVLLYNNDNDNNENITYDTSVTIPELELVIEKDLQYKQKLEMFVLPSNGVNDKKINLFINYDNSTEITKLNLLQSISLPVSRYTKAIDGTTLEPINKWSNNINVTPKQISLLKINSTLRAIQLELDGDFTDIESQSRVMLQNFVIKNPSNTITYNLSGTFKVYSTPVTLVESIESVSIISAGVGLTNGTSNFTVTSPLAGNSNKDIVLRLTVAGNILTDVQVIQSGYGFPLGSSNIVEITGLGGSSNAYVQLFPKVRTKMILALDSTNTIHSNFITAFNQYVVVNSLTFTNTTNGYYMPLNAFLTNYPYLTFNFGYKINITRINESNNTLDISDRYKIDIEQL